MDHHRGSLYPRGTSLWESGYMKMGAGSYVENFQGASAAGRSRSVARRLMMVYPLYRETRSRAKTYTTNVVRDG